MVPSTYDTTQYQAIHQAALDGNNPKIKELLRVSPALVNLGDYDKNTPLHLAAIHNHADTVKLLLDYKPDVNARNTAGMAALHVAAKAGFLEVVKALLVAKPDLCLKDSRGFTALTWAVQTHHDDVAALLRDSGAKE
jgi:ankyrin repeat protein